MNGLLSAIGLIDSEGVRFAKLQRFMRQAIDNAGISYAINGFLKDIQIGDSEGVRFAKLGAWTQLLADNITDAGGGGAGKAISGVDPSIESEDDLAAIVMVGATLPVVKVWTNVDQGSSETWRAILASDASDPGSVRRADDWATSGAVWFRYG